MDEELWLYLIQLGTFKLKGKIKDDRKIYTINDKDLFEEYEIDDSDTPT